MDALRCDDAAVTDSGALVRMVVCGSVDDGKSTLIGRLLAETGSVPDDEIATASRLRRPGSTVPPGQPDYSLITDGLQAERQQGITIDVAYRHLMLPSGRRVVVADAPGHEQYTRNMAVGASTADLALLLVDAVRGVRDQTLRHLAICSLLGVDHVVVAVNRLDVLDFDPEVFGRVEAAVAGAARCAHLSRLDVVPISALYGDNVLRASDRTPWYAGPTVLGTIERAPGRRATSPAVRLPVQFVLRADGLRAPIGTVAAGELRVGQVVRVSATGAEAVVQELSGPSGELAAAGAGDPVRVRLAPDVDVTRGDVLVAPTDPVLPANRFSADLFWMGDQPAMRGRSYWLVSGPLTVPATVTSVRHRMDLRTGAELATSTLTLNEIGRVEIATDRPVPLDAYERCRDTGGFLLVDRLTADTVGAGMVRFALRRSHTVVPPQFGVTRAARERAAGHRGAVAWFTGLSGAGKSTIADAVERELHADGVRTYLLDGDVVRSGLTKDLGFTPADRAENVRRVTEVARLMMDAGLVVLVCLVSPFRADRRAARAAFNVQDFIEVYVDTPVEVCAARDDKGLYARARAGEVPNLTGVGQAYEVPSDPDVVVSGIGDTRAAAETVLQALRKAIAPDG